MSKALYTSINGMTRKCRKMYAVRSGTTRKIKKGYCVVGGVTHKFFGGELRYYGQATKLPEIKYYQRKLRHLRRRIRSAVYGKNCVCIQQNACAKSGGGLIKRKAGNGCGKSRRVCNFRGWIWAGIFCPVASLFHSGSIQSSPHKEQGVIAKQLKVRYWKRAHWRLRHIRRWI